MQLTNIEKMNVRRLTKEIYETIDLVLIDQQSGKEKSPSDGHCQCEKEMDDHLLACQQIFEK
jgi:hypothetical protein